VNTPFPYQYICIEGNIGAGKTSFCKMLQKQYQCKLILEQFDENPFLNLFYEDPETYAFTVELFFMTSRHKQLQKSLIGQDLFSDFTIADYSFIKTLLFAKKNLDEEEYRIFQKLYDVLEQSHPTPDMMVYFHRSTDILMGNIKKRNRDFEKDITEEYLLKIQNTYFEYFRNILTYPVVIIDLNTVDFVNSEQSYEMVHDLIKKKYKPGVHRISLIT